MAMTSFPSIEKSAQTNVVISDAEARIVKPKVCSNNKSPPNTYIPILPAFAIIAWILLFSNLSDKRAENTAENIAQDVANRWVREFGSVWFSTS